MSGAIRMPEPDLPPQTWEKKVRHQNGARKQGTAEVEGLLVQNGKQEEERVEHE
jgi:hypothetical protein